MRNSAPGVDAGASKTMRVPISLRVASTTNTSFTSVSAADAPGVGRVERNTALHIMTLSRANSSRHQRTTTTRFAVARRRDLRKRTIVGAAIQAIVRGGGKSPPRTNAGRRRQRSPTDCVYNARWTENQTAASSCGENTESDSRRILRSECDGESPHNRTSFRQCGHRTRHAPSQKQQGANECAETEEPEELTPGPQTHAASAEKYAHRLKHERNKKTDNVGL